MQAGQMCRYTGRVKLVLNRQSSRMTVWNSIMSCSLQEDMHDNILTVSVAQMALKGRFTVSLALRSLSVCTALLCVLLNPAPVSSPPSP